MRPTPASPDPNSTPTAPLSSNNSSTPASTPASPAPRLPPHLDDAARAGADIAALLHQASSQHGPLPAEMPAAALWWRLAGTLAPPSLDRPDTKLRPPWITELHRLLGPRVAEAVITDPLAGRARMR